MRMILCFFLIFLVYSVLISSPMYIMVVILISALLGSVMFFKMYSTFFSMIFLLVYVGSILVMFIYFFSLMPRQRIDSLFLMKLMVILSLFMEFNFDFLQHRGSLNNFSEISNFISHYFMSIYLFIYLFFTMVIITKLVSSNLGPLRRFV